MQPASASSALLAVGIIAGEVALAAAGAAGPPDWIKVTPRGEAGTRDGRRYLFDPEALAARFASDGVDVAVDCDHALALKAAKGERVDAIGYAHAVQARPDGTYANVRWLEGGRAVLAARTHRYVSPTFYPDATGRAVWLHSIALVAAPALSMPALAHAHPESFMKQIATALGLPETADEAACLAALKSRPDTKALARALGLAETADAAACLAAAGKAGGALTPLAKALGLAETAGETACLAAIGTLKGGGGDLVAQLQAQLATTSAQLATLHAGVIEACMRRDVPVLRWEMPAAFAYRPEAEREALAASWCESVIAPCLARLDPRAPSFFGQDFGRVSDLTVIWPLQLRAGLYRETPFVVELRNIPFAQQWQILRWIVDRLPRFSAGALDAGGNGAAQAEYAAQEYGEHAIAQVKFSLDWYRENMPKLRDTLERRGMALPAHPDVLGDFKLVKMVDGIARVPRTRTTEKGEDAAAGKTRRRHGDAAIAAALAHFASLMPIALIAYTPAYGPEADGLGLDGVGGGRTLW